MIAQQKRYWNLNIPLKTLFYLYLIDLFPPLILRLKYQYYTKCNQV